MTKSRIQKLRDRFGWFINNEKDIDPSKLLTDLIDYSKEELKRSFLDSSVQSDCDHQRLMDQLESMINTLKPSDESEVSTKRRLP